MVTFRQFARMKFQVAAFRVPGVEWDTSRLLARVLTENLDRFSGPVQALPLPAEMPADVPRIQLRSKSGEWRFSASAERMDVIYIGEVAIDERIQVRACQDIMVSALAGIEAEASRLATIAEFVAQVRLPQQELIEGFCRPDVYDEAGQSSPLRNSRAFELHNLKRYTLEGFGGQCNSWVRCSGEGATDGGEGRLTVKLDINTLSEERHISRFATDRQRAFLDSSARELARILQVYFPDRP
jgi:hypothetical protein